MSKRHKLPPREQVFIESMMYHGFRRVHRRKDLKYKLGFLIPATRHEDAGGIDFWVKMPRDKRLFPIQITQRGVRMFRKYQRPSVMRLEEFILHSQSRIRAKQKRCRRHGIAFVLVRDFGGNHTNPQIAWGDIKALRYAIAHLKRWL